VHETKNLLISEFTIFSSASEMLLLEPLYKFFQCVSCGDVD